MTTTRSDPKAVGQQMLLFDTEVMSSIRRLIVERSRFQMQDNGPVNSQHSAAAAAPPLPAVPPRPRHRTSRSSASPRSRSTRRGRVVCRVHGAGTATVMGSEAPPEDYEPSLRQCLVVRPPQGSCGFHLSRTQWDPYPWVSDVEPGSAADKAGLVVGDCVLEVNGEDVLGMRIGAVALRVYARGDQVRLLVWNSGVEYNGAIWCSGNGPTPLSLQRLASCLQSVVSLLECPVCLETIPPPAFQCCNGHTLCGVCRSLTDRCPVCRVALGPRGRCLLADKLHMLFTATFLHSGGKKQKRSKAWRGQAPSLQLPSRLLPRTVPTPGPVADPPAYPCPLAPCDGVVRGGDLVSHLQTHDGPLVQYFCKESSTLLRFPVTRMTTITVAQGATFLLHVAPAPGAPALLLWLWQAAAGAPHYRLQLDRPGRAPLVRPAVFPMSWSPSKVLQLAAEQCVVLDDCDFDTNCTKVKITILSDQDATRK